MNFRISCLMCGIATLFFTLAAPASAAGPTAPDLNTAGAEGLMLAAQAGRWTITETVWAAPRALPVVTGRFNLSRCPPM
jgi:hypothetical protein